MAATLTLRTMTHDGGVRLEISDTGAGLTREECERLFTPYYTTKLHGTGLGLAIVQSVVSDHGGRISVSSEPGHGTTFRIELLERPPNVVRRLTPCPSKVNSRGTNSGTQSVICMVAKAHILIIDDDANTLASLSRAFRLSGHEATVCDNAARALELARDGHFDLILSDVVMPGKDGIALLEEIKDLRASRLPS